MRKKIGELLIESGAVSQEQIHKALGQQRVHGSGQRLGSVIVTLGFTSPAEVARALARQFELPFVELPEIPEEVRSLVSLDFQAEHRIVLFRLERQGRTERLHVAVDDPSDLTVVDEVSYQLNKPVHVHVAAEDDVDRALDLVSGRALGLLALEEVDGESLLEQGSPEGHWLGAEDTPASPSAALSALLDGELSTSPTPPLLDEDDDITLITPRSALKSKPPAPPAPPPFEEEDDDITLITPRATPRAKAAAKPPPPPPQESEEVLDELLGDGEPPPPTKPPAAPNKKGVPVVVFGGAAQGTPLPPPPPELPDITDEDLKVLEDIERMADGAEATLHTEKVKPARMVASLIRLLIRKRVIREEEFLEELSRK
ncbi:general secretion pathway protein GspE [Vitiosangium sp. GDMCC 1.1324]|uniref:GspE/PulE/PilB domain-containing protein n=1 Tax=Vitiosangium sp. (strain GDMCC 1.1324) TaxID=2138576 RepID=UPI000D3813EC|nr:general secretion pathway protein GspE [Vitiosangium sp. GDMCC 1.1324]PTL76124.1 general secretion pathway protein GspE [Vitiosangium sp. GDMCC 1.1324]